MLFWLLSPGERTRRELIGRLELGDPETRVEGVMGPPAARCPGEDLVHLAESFPPGWPAVSVETTLQMLGEQTRERWVYPLSARASDGCAPADRQTEMGFDGQGQLLWYVGIVGETPLRLPDSYTPAAAP